MVEAAVTRSWGVAGLEGAAPVVLVSRRVVAL